MRPGVASSALALAFLVISPALAAPLPSPLTGDPGNPARGRAIVADRSRGLCLLCHSAPIPEQRFQGNLSTNLAGSGSRWSPAELRQRLVDPRSLNPETIMPAFFSTDGLERVGPTWRGRTILSAVDIEDVVAYLGTLRDEAEPSR